VPTVCVPSGSQPCPRMNYDNTNSRFTYAGVGGSVVSSIFTRQIFLTSLSADEYQLTVIVSWSDLGSITRRVTVYENIFKWQ
jgi:hypothetical protein